MATGTVGTCATRWLLRGAAADCEVTDRPPRAPHARASGGETPVACAMTGFDWSLDSITCRSLMVAGDRIRVLNELADLIRLRGSGGPRFTYIPLLGPRLRQQAQIRHSKTTAPKPAAIVIIQCFFAKATRLSHRDENELSFLSSAAPAPLLSQLEAGTGIAESSSSSLPGYLQAKSDAQKFQDRRK
jgi:hypothetical protein